MCSLPAGDAWLPWAGGQGCNWTAEGHTTLGAEKEKGGPGLPPGLCKAGPGFGGESICGLICGLIYIEIVSY